MTTVLETRRAPAIGFAPGTLDLEAGTVDVNLTTGAPVQRGSHLEVLAIGPENVEFAPRIPLLDSHRQTSIADIKGSVSNIRFEPGAVVATLNISDPSALAAVARGDVTGVSIGYRVKKWSPDRRDPKSGKIIRTAVLFEIVEASLVAVPADANATIRSYPVEEDDIIEAPAGAEMTSDQPEAITRAQATVIARAANLANPDQFVADVTTAGFSQQETRSLALQQQRERSISVSTIRVGPSGDDPEVVLERRAEAMAYRAGGPEPSEAARQYVNHTLLDEARLSLRMAGVTGISTMGREEIFTRALNGTSDFPALLLGTGNRMLMPAYQAAQSPLKQLARQTTATDFRAKATIRFGNFPKLKEVTEHGEITSVSTTEATESYAIKTFGATAGVTRKALINDDLGAFGRVMGELGRAAAETEADQLVALLTGNPVMEDGNALFSAAHGNLSATGAAPDVDSLSAARLALRRQTGLDGVSPISATPKFILAAPELETTFEKLLAELAAAKVDDQNPFSGKMTLLIEPRLSGDDWYVFADPAMLPVLEYAYLSSAQGPQIASRDGWEVLGREFRVVLDFGCGAVDWRGAYHDLGEDDL